MRGALSRIAMVAVVLSLGMEAAASAVNRPVVCTPRPTDLAMPPPWRPTSATLKQDPPKPLCPAGQVPVPVPWTGRKAKLPSRASGATPWVWMPLNLGTAALAPQTYFFAGAEQSIATDGADMLLTEAAPRLASTDALSLAELAVQSADQAQSVITGWMVNQEVNGDSNPHLFVYHWVNDAGTCFNGCGWKQSSTTRTPGMVVTTSTTPESYAILHFSGNWWVWYEDEWIGYFPDSTWTSPTFTRAGFVQWLGQVAAASSTAPASQMGNGTFGSVGGSAQFASLRTYQGETTSTAQASLAGTSLATAYDATRVDGANFRFGGPGFPPCVPQCTGVDCGDNGCGGSCGTCSTGYACTSGICVGGAGDTCANAIPITPSGTRYLSGDTSHAGEDYSSAVCGGLGRDRVYSFTLTSPTVLDADVSGFDTVLYLRETCTSDASELVCNDDISETNFDSELSASLDPGTYYLFVDGYASADGTYDLTATFTADCMAETCFTVANRCGTLSDGCDGILNCGGCSSPLSCGGGGTPNVCGRPDAGPGPVDAGPRDAGPVDAGPVDGGPVDAGAPDAGSPDAGSPDAGHGTEPDAGTPTTRDAGHSGSTKDGGLLVIAPKKDEKVPTSGCGCSAMSGSAAVGQGGMFLLLAWATRRRRRVL